MTLRRLASKVVAWWTARRVDRALPELAEIRREIEERRRKHQPTRRLMRAQRELVKARLAVELGASVTASARASR